MSEKTHRLKCMAREIMENKINYTVCERCDAINKKYNELCWRCEYDKLLQREEGVEQALISILRDEDLEYYEDGKFRYITVNMKGLKRDK